MTGSQSRIDDAAIHSHGPQLRATAARILKDDSLVADVVQQTWLCALEKPPSHRNALPAWLGAVVRNSARRVARDARRHRRLIRDIAPRGGTIPIDEAVERLERQREVLTALLNLPPVYRDVVVFRFYEDLSPGQIAERDGVSIHTVRTRLKRALKLLRVTLARSPETRRAAMAPGGGLMSPSLSLTTHNAVWKLGMGASLMSLKAPLFAGAIALLLVAAGWFFLKPQKAPPSLAKDSVVGTLGTSPRAKSVLPPENRQDRPGRHPRDGAAGTVGLPAADRSSLRGSREAAPETVKHGQDASNSEAAAAVLAEYARIKETYRDSPFEGWHVVRESIAAIRDTLGNDDGVAEFLRILDAETDSGFLEAVLYHLANPDAGSWESLQRVVTAENLAAELWHRFEEETDTRRRSYLGFFGTNPELSKRRIEELEDVARHDSEPQVRASALAGWSSAVEPSRRLAMLVDIAERDSSEICRASAIRTLAAMDSPETVGLVNAAYRDPSERVRAAALEARRPPAEVHGNNFADFLQSEFRNAASKEYQGVLIDRLLATAPSTLAVELERAMAMGVDERTEEYFATIIALIGQGVHEKYRILRMARRVHNRWRYTD